MLNMRSLFLFLLVFVLNEASAVDKFWRPLGGNLTWNQPNNWIPQGVPNSGDYVHFDSFNTAQCFVDGAESVQGIILDSGYTGVVWLTNDFYDLTQIKSLGASVNVSNGDNLNVANSFTSSSGPFNGVGRINVVEASALIGSSHTARSLSLRFSGGDCTLNVQNNSNLYDTVEVAIPSGALHFIDTNGGTYLVGSNTQRFILEQGEVTFDPIIPTVDWQFNVTIIEDGVFTSSSQTLDIKEDLLMTGGSFDGNGGTVVFESGAASFLWLNVVPEFHNVTINKSFGAAVNLQPGEHINVNGTLTFSAGNANGGSIHSYGNVAVGSSFGGGDSELRFKGSNEQLFSLTNATTRYEGVITLDKQNEDVVLGSNLRLEDNFTQLQFIQGNIRTENFFVEVLNGVANPFTGASDDSYIDRKVRKFGVNEIVFPMGHEGWYAPIRITGFNTFSDQIEVGYRHESLANDAIQDNPPIGIDHLSQCEYWTVERISGTALLNIDLSYNTNRCGPIDDEPALRVARFATPQWVDMGATMFDGNFVTSSSAVQNPLFVTLASTNANNPMDNSSTVGCTGDLDNDGSVSTTDLLIFLSDFGCTSGCTADITGDDSVDAADLLTFLAAFGTSCF